jgi:hypothetical protein
MGDIGVLMTQKNLPVIGVATALSLDKTDRDSLRLQYP